MVYLRERYYNTLTRRFINPDPARDGWNWYAYAGADPMGFVDPTGLGQMRTLDILQKGLAVLGMLPGVGEIFDVVNAGISFARGNYSDAAIHLASAVPGLGNAVAGAKMAGGVATASIAMMRIQKNSTPLTRSVGQLRAAGAKDAHHVIQDAAVRNLPGYSTRNAPGVQLPGPSTAIGSPHYRATQVQRQAGGGTYAAERRIGYKALRRSGYSKSDARQIITETDSYFKSIGVTPFTPTRIPGNR